MDNRQKKSNSFYDGLARKSENLSEIVGRSPSFAGKEDVIIRDIHKKLNIQGGNSLLDIGCGFGNITIHFLEYAKNYNIELTLLDIDSVIERIKSDNRFDTENVNLIKGTFPGEMSTSIDNKFNNILVYSVLHYTDHPELFIEKAVSFLEPGGTLLIGDLPNINRMGRFQSTEFGRIFEAKYKGKMISEIPKYRDQYHFVEQRKDDYNNLINDDLVFETIRKYRSMGYDVWVVPQPAELPFSNSREDIIIKKWFK